MTTRPASSARATRCNWALGSEPGGSTGWSSRTAPVVTSSPKRSCRTADPTSSSATTNTSWRVESTTGVEVIPTVGVMSPQGRSPDGTGAATVVDHRIDPSVADRATTVSPSVATRTRLPRTSGSPNSCPPSLGETHARWAEEKDVPEGSAPEPPGAAVVDEPVAGGQHQRDQEQGGDAGKASGRPSVVPRPRPRPRLAGPIRRHCVGPTPVTPHAAHGRWSGDSGPGNGHTRAGPDGTADVRGRGPERCGWRPGCSEAPRTGPPIRA